MVKSILLYCFLAYLAVISEVGGRHPEDGLTQHILQCGLDVEVFLDWSGQYVRFGRIPRNRDAFARSLLCLGRKRGFLDANNDAILPTGSQVIRKKTAFCTETRPSSPTTRRALYAIDCLMLRKKSRKFNEPVYEEVGKIWLRKEIKNDYRHLARRIREITTDTYRKDLNDGLKEDFSDKTLNVLLRSISDRSANNTQHSEPTKAATDVANGFRRKRLENIAANKKVDMNKYDQFINRNFVQFQQDAPREINGEFYISDRGTIFIMDKDVEISKHMQYHKSADITQVLTQFGRLVRHRMIARTHTSADRIQFIVDTDRSKWYSDKTTIDLLELFAESERTVQGPISCLMYVLKGQVVFLWVKQFDKITDQYPGIRDTFVDSKEITRGPIHCHFYISRRKMIAVVNENVEHFLRLRRNVQEHSQEVVCEYDCEDENEIAVNVNVDKTLPEPYSVEREIYGKLYFSKSKTLLIIENNMEITEQIQFRKSADITEILSEFDRSLTEHQIIAGVRVFADKTLFTLRRPLQSYFHKTVDISGLFGEKEHIVKGPVSVLLYILKNKIVLVHMKNMQEVYSHNRDDSRSIFQELEQAIRSPLHCQLYFSRTNVIVIIDENIEYYTNLPLDKPTLPASVLQNDTVCEYDCQDEQKNIVDAIMRPNFFQHQAVQRKICDGTFYFSNRKTLFIIEKDVDAVKYMHHHKTVNISGILKEIGNLAQQKMATATYTAVDKTLFIVNTNYTFQLNKQVDVMDLFMESERIMQGPIKCLMYVLKNQVVFLYINPDDERYHEYMNARHIFREIKEIVKGPIYCDIYLSNRNINILIDENIENYMRRKLLPQQPKKYYPADGTECKNGYCKDDQNSIKIDIKVEKNLHRRKMSRWDINGNMYISSENTIIIMEKKADVIRNIQSGNRMNITDIIKNFGTIRARKVTAKTHIYKDKTYFMINNTSQNTYDETIHIEETITQKERFALGPIHCILYILQDKIVLLYTKEYLVKYPQLPNTHTIIHENEKVLNGPIPCQLYISYSKLIFVLNENIERLTLAPQYTISETAEPVRQPELVPHHNEQCDPDCDHDHNAITINVNVRKDFFKYDTIRRQIAGDLYVSETKTVIIIDKDAEVIKNIDTESTVDIQDLIDDVGVLYGARQVVAEAQVSLDRTIFVLNNSSVTYYDKAINAVDLIISEEERYVHGPVHCLLYILKDRIVLLHMKEYQDAYPHLPISHAIFDDSEVITKGPIWCRFYASQRKLLFLLDENIFRFDGTLFVNSDFAMPVSNDEVVCEYDCDDQNGISIDVNVQEDVRAEEVIRRDIRGVFYFSKYKTMFVMDKDVLVARRFRFHNFVDISGIISAFDEPVEHQVLSETRISLGMTLFIIRSHLQPYLRKTVSASELFTKEELIVQGPVHGLLYIVGNRITFVYMEKYLDLYPHYPDVGTIFNKTEEIVNGPMQCNFYISHSKIIVVVNENLKNHIQPNQVPSPHSSRFGFD